MAELGYMVHYKVAAYGSLVHRSLTEVILFDDCFMFFFT